MSETAVQQASVYLVLYSQVSFILHHGSIFLTSCNVKVTEIGHLKFKLKC